MTGLQRLVGAEVGRPRFHYRQGDDDALFFVDDVHCTESACAGSEVTVDLTSADGSHEDVRLRIDLRDGHVSWRKDLAEKQQAVARAFVHDRVMLRLLERRRQLSRAWRMAQRGTAREEKLVEGRLYPLTDFDPTEQYAMVFAVDGADWAVIDRYCVAPGCSCVEAILDVYGPGPAQAAPLEYVFSARVDLVTGKACSPETRAPLTPDQRRILAAFQEEAETWREELTIRRRLIREAASHRRAPRDRSSAGRVGRRRKPGRNRRCPCGSGKKYKRCCEVAAAPPS